MQIVTRNEVSVTLLKVLIFSVISIFLFMGSYVDYIANAMIYLYVMLCYFTLFQYLISFNYTIIYTQFFYVQFHFLVVPILRLQ